MVATVKTFETGTAITLLEIVSHEVGLRLCAIAITEVECLSGSLGDTETAAWRKGNSTAEFLETGLAEDAGIRLARNNDIDRLS